MTNATETADVVIIGGGVMGCSIACNLALTTNRHDLRRIVLPLIWPVVTVVLLLRLVDEIRIFDVILIITRGGPGSSTLLASMNIYSIFHAGRLGVMAAYGVLMVIAINIVVISFLRVLHRQEKATRQKVSA